MANARIQKTDEFYYKESQNRFEFAFGEQSDSNNPWFNCIDRDTSEPGISISEAATVGNGLFLANGNAFQFQASGSRVIEYCAILGARISLTPVDCRFKILRQKASQNFVNIDSWTENADHHLTVSTASAHGIVSGDFVSIHNNNTGDDNYITSGGGNLVIEDNGDSFSPVPAPVYSTPLIDEFQLRGYAISSTGDSSGSVVSNTITVWEEIAGFDIQLTTTAKDIFIETSAAEAGDFFVMSHQSYSGSQYEFQFNRVMAGELIQPTKNIQPPIITPIKESERIEMENGSYRYEPASSKKDCSIEWLSLPIDETKDIMDMIEFNLKSRPILMTAFPGDSDSDWQRRNTVIGVLDSAEVEPFIENENEYYSSGRMRLIGTVFDEIY